MSEEAAEYRPPTPWIVWAIVGAIGVSYAAFLLASPDMRNAIDFAFALIPERFHADSPYRFNQWYEALGPIFGHTLLHAAWWHAGLNAFFFFATGRHPAMVLGPWRFLALYLISAAGGAIAFILINWNEHGAVAVGASGAVCGVFSAYFLSARRTWREALADPRVRGPFGMIFLLNVVLMAVVSELGLFPIAWEGHMGGFIAGALAYVALAPKREAWP